MNYWLIGGGQRRQLSSYAIKRPEILARSNSTRKIGRLILQRRRAIAPSIAPSRIFFKKPAGSLVCRAKSACLAPKKSPERTRPHRLDWYDTFKKGPTCAGGSQKRLQECPGTTEYHAMSQITAAAPAIGFHRRRIANMIDARPIRIRNHSPFISWRNFTASTISDAPIISAQAAI